MTTRAWYRLILVFLVQLLSTQTVLPQAAPTANAPKTVQIVPTTDYSKEPYVFELIETKARFEVDGKSQRELTIRVRIQSESAVRDLGLLTYRFASSFESLSVEYVRVRKPDGSVVETPASDVQELDSAVSREAPMYSDQREKHIAVKALGVGDVLEARLQWTEHDAIAPGRFWLEDSYFKEGICLKEIIQLDVPRAVNAKLSYTEPKPKVEDKGDRRVYTFENTHLAKTPDSKIPDWEKNFYGLDPPDIQISSFESWDDLGGWFAGLQEGKGAVTPEIRAKAEELTKGAANEEEKIRALYDFVSLKFRYIGVDLGIGRYAAHVAADILANRYGDCKDKHTLFAALLKAAGITACPALISSRFKTDGKFPTAALFDHVITAIPRGDSYLFLDTTPEVTPYGMLLAGLRGRRALVVGDGHAAKLVKTPVDPPFRSYVTVKIDSAIDTQGTLEATMHLEERGDDEFLVRSAFRATPQNRWEDLTQLMVARMGFAGKVSEVSVANPEDTTKPFTIS